MDMYAPYLWIAAAAAVLALAGLSLLLGRGGGRDAAGRRRFRLRPVRRLVGLLATALAVVSALLAGSIFQFARLLGDEPVALVELSRQDERRFLATLRLPDAAARQYALNGDQWQIDAQVVRWRLPALLAGVPPLYRLERLSGRYDDLALEQSEPRTVHALGEGPVPSPGLLKRRYPRWLPFVDVAFGSGAYMPMFDGARYRVFLDPRGALFVRPADEATAARLRNGPEGAQEPPEQPAQPDQDAREGNLSGGGASN